MSIEASSAAGTGRLGPTHEPRVAVLFTNPGQVIPDFANVMKLAGFDAHLPKTSETLLKVNTCARPA